MGNSAPLRSSECRADGALEISRWGLCSDRSPDGVTPENEEHYHSELCREQGCRGCSLIAAHIEAEADEEGAVAAAPLPIAYWIPGMVLAISRMVSMLTTIRSSPKQSVILGWRPGTNDNSRVFFSDCRASIGASTTAPDPRRVRPCTRCRGSAAAASHAMPITPLDVVKSFELR